MDNNKNVVLQVRDYDHVDGNSAYSKKDKKISIGCEETEIIMKICEGEKVIELPLHRALDLAILASQSLLYFQEAYRHPKLYDPNNTTIEKIGLQGSSMTLEVCTENENIDHDIDQLSRLINKKGDLLGERIRMLSEVLEEMGY